jgi:formate hydrogenlyase subunit 6/NADH:ubiquinone oxidoreductase subunit I
VRHDVSACTGCSNCESICPVRAIDVHEPPPEAPGAASAPEVSVNQYLCNVCLDCVRACPTKSLRYGQRR